MKECDNSTREMRLRLLLIRTQIICKDLRRSIVY